MGPAREEERRRPVDQPETTDKADDPAPPAEPAQDGPDPIVDQTSEAMDEPTVPTKQTDAALRAAGAAATPNQRGHRERTAPHAAGGPEGPRSPARHVDQLATPLGWRGVGSAPPTRIQVRG